MDKNIQRLTCRPKIVAVIAETNQGKSNLLYNLIMTLNEKGEPYNLHTYGLRFDLGENKIHSLAELEGIRDSVIIIDEFQSLFDTDNRKNKKAIENSLRLINHNNNILFLCGLPDNFKKFISNKVDIFIFKKCRIGSFINGSWAKSVCLEYRGQELGSTVLELGLDEAIIYDGTYTKINVPYMEGFDTKKSNKKIVTMCAKPSAETSGKLSKKIVSEKTS